MSDSGRPVTDEVELLLTNAQLRDELEPYRDESIDESPSRMSLEAENEYLASMLAWERAPALPIHSWFDPPLNLPALDSLNDEQVRLKLRDSIYRMFDHGIVLRYTEHLSDRELYKILVRDILPSCEKKVDLPGKKLEFHCLDDGDTETWLRFYANPVERRRFQEEYDIDIPVAEDPKFNRDLPE